MLEKPYEGKALQRELTGYYSIRHGQYRVICSVNAKKKWVVVEFVGNDS